MKNLLMLLAAAGLMAACSQRQSLTLSAADQEAIRMTSRDAVKLWNDKGDVAGYVHLYYTPDAVILPPNGKAVKGHDDIASFLGSFPPVVIQFSELEMAGSGDMAFVHGAYKLTPRDSTGISDEGKFIEIWQRQRDGSWKTTHDIFNSDLPLFPGR